MFNSVSLCVSSVVLCVIIFSSRTYTELHRGYHRVPLRFNLNPSADDDPLILPQHLSGLFLWSLTE